MLMFRRLAAVLLAAVTAVPLSAQSEGGLIVGIEAEKKLSKKVAVGIEADMRTRNNFRTMDRWGIGISGSYELTKWLKGDIGYSLLDYNNRERITYYTSSAGNAKIKWRPSYWGVKHRFNVGLTGSHKFGNGLKLSLRERWQYSYRPEASTDRYKMKISDQTMTLDSDYARSGKGKSQLRSRLELSYDKKYALLSPYASAEMYNAWSVEKMRYTVGTDIRLSKHHSIDVFYRFQKAYGTDDEDYDPDMHHVGIGYKIKF